jgi:hypothetical protein
MVYDGLSIILMVILHSKRNCEITKREHTLLDSCFLIGSSTIQRNLHFLLKTPGWDNVGILLPVSLDVTGHHPKTGPQYYQATFLL